MFSPTKFMISPFADLDRANLGNARLQGFPEDVLGGDPTGNLFDWTNTAFFVAYVCAHTTSVQHHTNLRQVLFPVPATIISKLVPPRIWIGCAVIGWGITSTLLSTAFNVAGAICCRVFLGVFEAAFAPGST